MRVTNEHGWTALHYAAFLTNRVAMARELLAKGADVHARTKNNFPTPLHKAATEGDLELVEILLEAGADPNSGSCPTGTTLIEAATKRHREAIVDRLRRAGVIARSPSQRSIPVYRSARLQNSHPCKVRFVRDDRVGGSGG